MIRKGDDNTEEGNDAKSEWAVKTRTDKNNTEADGRVWKKSS